MCFSAEVDVLAGVVVGAVGVDALRHVRQRSEEPLAVLPVILAGHQLIEAFVWWGLDGRISEAVWRPAAWLYVAIAFGVLPVFVPIAVGALEPVANRSRIRWFTAIGAFVAIVLMYAVVRGPLDVSIEGHHISYVVDLWRGGVIVALYLVATCGSMLVSDHAHVRWFGGANLVAACALTWLDKSAFISLWCVWAAVTSVAIAVHLRCAALPPRQDIPVTNS